MWVDHSKMWIGHGTASESSLWSSGKESLYTNEVQDQKHTKYYKKEQTVQNSFKSIYLYRIHSHTPMAQMLDSAFTYECSKTQHNKSLNVYRKCDLKLFEKLCYDMTAAFPALQSRGNSMYLLHACLSQLGLPQQNTIHGVA